jgi:acyl carrier protein
MDEQQTLEALSRILGDLLFDSSIELKRDTARADVPGWDSFAYVNFIVAVEAEFGVRFRIADVESFQTVGDIVKGIEALKQTSSGRASAK